MVPLLKVAHYAFWFILLAQLASLFGSSSASGSLVMMVHLAVVAHVQL
jgi:hypothetical protein